VVFSLATTSSLYPVDPAGGYTLVRRIKPCIYAVYVHYTKPLSSDLGFEDESVDSSLLRLFFPLKDTSMVFVYPVAYRRETVANTCTLSVFAPCSFVFRFGCEFSSLVVVLFGVAAASGVHSTPSQAWIEQEQRFHEHPMNPFSV